MEEQGEEGREGEEEKAGERKEKKRKRRGKEETRIWTKGDEEKQEMKGEGERMGEGRKTEG